ncbi:MAG: hypothetical protein GY856_22405 [bacterium]|nr:hypothetical protein [bacterium]
MDELVACTAGVDQQARPLLNDRQEIVDGFIAEGREHPLSEEAFRDLGPFELGIGLGFPRHLGEDTAQALRFWELEWYLLLGCELVLFPALRQYCDRFLVELRSSLRQAS